MSLAQTEPSEGQQISGREETVPNLNVRRRVGHGRRPTTRTTEAEGFSRCPVSLNRPCLEYKMIAKSLVKCLVQDIKIPDIMIATASGARRHQQ
jgi:hypothetical protein